MTQSENRRPRVLSGMRPTGKLHLGNLVGALQNWVQLQDRYESYHFVADWHMLTTDYADPSGLQANIQEMVTDWLAVGLDPEKATFFVQSRLPEHAELFLLFCMVTPLGWVERVPTYKEQLENVQGRDLHTYGFLGYPVLQAADILMYKADYVPVGEDQVPHVELTREIARRFNLAYGELVLAERADKDWESIADSVGLKKELKAKLGKDAAERKQIFQDHFRASSIDDRASYLNSGIGDVRAIFPEPQSLLTPSPRLRGTDGRKMSKSYGNAIFLSDPPEVVSKKMAGMMTDPARQRRGDKGNPEVCPVFDHHKLFSPSETVERINGECRTAEIGCVNCKKLMAQHLNKFLEPIQERRKIYEQAPQKVWDVLETGTQKARAVAQQTMTEVRAAVKLT
jgi:tryptophanyl-tRNA synthetase